MQKTPRLDLPRLAILLAVLVGGCDAQRGSPTAAAVLGASAAAATSVVWSVQEAGGGTIDSSGLYTAPAVAGSYNVVATSAVNGAVAGAALVQVTGSGNEIVPTARRTTWNPGLAAVGGIPNRTTICATANAATYGNGSTDATAYIRGLIDACPAGQVVYLPAGTYLISGTDGILFNRSNVTLRGAGTSTRLVKNPGSNGPVIHMGPRWASDKFTTSTNLTSDAVKGSRSVTVASTTGLSAGMLVLLDATTDPSVTWLSARMDVGGGDYPAALTWFFRSNRPVAQLMEIESVSGSTVTFSTPFHLTFPVSRTAQLSRNASAAITMSGVENLYVSGGEGGDSGGNIHLTMTKYSWVKNVESNFAGGTAINLDAAFRCEVRDSYIHTGGVMEPGGGGYLLGINRGSADCLVENNILWNGNKVMVVRAAGGGCVFGYNYAEDGRINSNPAFVETGLNASHMTTPFMVLFEGNQGWNFDSDEVWGNSVYMTIFRNHLTTRRGFYYSPANGGTDRDMRFAAGSGAHSWYFNFVGNVLGHSGDMLGGSPQTSQIYEATTGGQTSNNGLLKMWMLGHGPGGNPTATPSATVIAQTLRHGNYDYVSNQVVWDAATSNHALPASLYLTGKPSFFGTATWPWVTPDGATKVYTLPAKARFDAMPTH